MDKRGQISAFIIVGLIMLIAGGIFIFLDSEESNITTPIVEDTLPSQARPINNYVLSCIKQASETPLLEIAKQGGTFKNSNVYYNGTQTQYFCSGPNCANNKVLLSSIEEELQTIILPRLEACLDFTTFEDQGYNLQTGSLDIAVQINDDDTFVTALYPTSIKLDGNEIFIENYTAQLPFAVGRAFDLAVDITNTEITSPFNKEEWMISQGSELIVEKHRTYPDTFYTIHAPNMSFTFGVQGEDTTGKRFVPNEPVHGCCLEEGICYKNTPESTCSGTYNPSPGCLCNTNFDERELEGCCQLENQCSILSKRECNQVGGNFDEDLSCASFTCDNLDCGEYKHGQSWCDYEGIVAPGSAYVGSRHYQKSCINGQVLTEECRDFREEICVEDREGQAACRVNRWADCGACDTQDCCENREERDCAWSEWLDTGNKCAPYVPPGFRFWEGGGANICAQGNQEETFEGLNCPLDWADSAAVYCLRQGDCGAYRNVADAITKEGFLNTCDQISDFVFHKNGYNTNPAEDGSRWTLDLGVENTNQDELLQTPVSYTASINKLISIGLKYADQLEDVSPADLLNPFSDVDDFEYPAVSFCQPWFAPKGGTFCEACNQREYPCTEYFCKSLGQTCVFELQEGVGHCSEFASGDKVPPVIFLENLSISENFTANAHTFRNEFVGANISPALPPFELFTFGIVTSEPTQCKLTYLPDANFAGLPAFWFGDATFKTNHTITFRPPARLEVPGSFLEFLESSSLTDALNKFDSLVDKHFSIVSLSVPILSRQKLPLFKAILEEFNNGQYYLFVQCSDRAGNVNNEEFFISFTIDNSTVDNKPPEILAFRPQNNSVTPAKRLEQEVSVFTNEPALCFMGEDDLGFTFLKEMDCAFSDLAVTDVEGGSFQCSSLVDVSQKNNQQLFIRCVDNPKLLNLTNGVNLTELDQKIAAGEIRSTENHQLNFRKSRDIAIIDIETSSKGDEPILVRVNGETDDISCGIGEDTAGFKRMFFNGETYQRSLNLDPGQNYEFTIKCTDDLGNEVRDIVEFFVED